MEVQKSVEETQVLEPLSSSGRYRGKRYRKSPKRVIVVVALLLAAFALSLLIPGQEKNTVITTGGKKKENTEQDGERKSTSFTEKFQPHPERVYAIGNPDRLFDNLGLLTANGGIEVAIEDATETLPTEAVTANSDEVKVYSEDKVKVHSEGGVFAWPISVVRYSSQFGLRTDPFTKKSRFHTGLDMGAACGSPVYAAEDGIVEAAGNTHGGYGIRIVVRHKGNLKTMYSHLSGVLVEPGTLVPKGKLIGLVGTTGRSTGCHLHFEVGLNGSYVDPLPYLLGGAGNTSQVPYGSSYTVHPETPTPGVETDGPDASPELVEVTAPATMTPTPVTPPVTVRPVRPTAPTTTTTTPPTTTTTLPTTTTTTAPSTTTTTSTTLPPALAPTTTTIAPSASPATTTTEPLDSVTANDIETTVGL